MPTAIAKTIKNLNATIFLPPRFCNPDEISFPVLHTQISPNNYMHDRIIFSTTYHMIPKSPQLCMNTCRGSQIPTITVQ